MGSERTADEKRMNAGTIARQPVFVVGCQRSGSTLLGSILGAHSDIVCLPEAQFIVDVMPGLDPQAICDPIEIVDRIEAHWRFRIWGFELAGARPPKSGTGSTYRAVIEWLVDSYAKSVGRGRASIWVDQQPGNVLCMSRLLKHFPDAKVINIVRDGRAVAASLMPLDWGPNEVYSAAKYWRERVGMGYTASSFLGSNQLLHVRYEDLVLSSERVVPEIARFVGVSYEESMLNADGIRLPRFTQKQHALVGSRPDKARIDAWRRILTPREVQIFESVVGDLLEQMGYQREYGLDVRPMSRLEKVVQLTREGLKRWWRAGRFRIRRMAHSSSEAGGNYRRGAHAFSLRVTP